MVDTRRTPVDEVLLAFTRLAVDVSVRTAEELGGLSPVQLRALTVLQDTSGANLAALAGQMGVTVSTASRLVDRLVAAGWVHRGPSPHNRRSISLSLTAAGTSLLRRYDRGRMTLLHEHLRRLPAERHDVVVRLLGDVASTVHP